MIYCVGPEGDQANDAQDFIDAVEGTGKNLFRAVGQYNEPTANRVPIDLVRVCLVSFLSNILVHISSLPPRSRSLPQSPSPHTHFYLFLWHIHTQARVHTQARDEESAW